MKSMTFIFAVFIVLVFVATPVLAGIEPSPFTPEINQCNAAVNMLEATDHKLNITLDKAPVGEENITGALNQLETTEKRLVSVGSFIDSIWSDIAAVMGFEPSPFNDPDLIAAFEAVQSAAQQVADTAARELPEGVPSQFIDALGQVGFTAEELVENVTAYIGQLSDEINCGGLTGDACIPPCEWNPETGICSDPTYDNP